MDNIFNSNKFIFGVRAFIACLFIVFAAAVVIKREYLSLDYKVNAFFAAMLIVYGLFRLYRAYKNYKENEEFN
jgi:hypothetical protein